MKWLAAALLVITAVPALAQDPDPKKPKVKRQPNVISFEEIELIRPEVTNAYEIIQRLRPNYLRGRGPSTFGNSAGAITPVPQVVVDGAPRGDLSTLRQMPAMTIREIRYLNASDASTQYGTGYDGGAILLFTRTH
jgi:hypothetical protein